ncbi:hypothetical protein IHQ71_12995 [Rhizobium sp. TH2]|uniref:hypothetical protein n=1 Tax=Rhizobium sp. TH2 TaxID=2775403 RepID=UPI0021570A68|nr:hypothetical protein [Rhizobium sp. TH2]UVC11405.1 hypothetical protein IHQ71_12995 [Rhizobium sp. TH2]
MPQIIFQILAIGLIAIVGTYLVLCIMRLRSVPRQQAEMKQIGDENTRAVRENSDLLRELIALNRQILERQNQANS